MLVWYTASPIEVILIGCGYLVIALFLNSR